jgi:hypothetical protein
MEPSAKVICDSISPQGIRLTTFEAVMHRFVLAEFNTHRVFSRNSASSRAIPLRKQLDKVRDDTAIPVAWPAEQKGMQGGEPLPDPLMIRAYRRWLQAADSAADAAEMLGELGVHKSVANRLLEPFMWHTVVVTATSYQNFFGLRCNPMAQPEIRATADAMKAAYDASTPQLLEPGMWHMPYLRDDDWTEFFAGDLTLHDLIRISSARVARSSYLTQNGIRDPSEDLVLYRRLVSADPMHASPLEQVATPNKENIQTVTVQRKVMMDGVHPGRIELTVPKYGNLLGWHQHRFDVEILKGYQAHS